jgi:hypothetical protein
MQRSCVDHKRTNFPSCNLSMDIVTFSKNGNITTFPRPNPSKQRNATTPPHHATAAMTSIVKLRYENKSTPPRIVNFSNPSSLHFGTLLLRRDLRFPPQQWKCKSGISATWKTTLSEVDPSITPGRGYNKCGRIASARLFTPGHSQSHRTGG